MYNAELDPRFDPLKSLGQAIIDSTGVKSEDITIVNPWHQAGGETFCTDFTFSSGDERVHLIAKACIKTCPAETFRDWLDRRALIEAQNISVPKVILTQKALLVEEFIPYTFKEAYDKGAPNVQEKLKSEFEHMYETIAELGFYAVSFHDIRSRVDDLVMIDFGIDLGGQSKTKRSTFNNQLLLEQHLHKILTK